MAELKWSENSNIENSLYDYFKSKIETENITVRDNNGSLVIPEVTVSRKFDDSWNLPIVALRETTVIAPVIFVGTTKTDRTYLVVIDIFCQNETQKKNFTAWLRDKLEPGFPYYEWVPNGNTPAKTLKGTVSVSFVTDTEVNLGEDASDIDKYRHRISVNCQIRLKN